MKQGRREFIKTGAAVACGAVLAGSWQGIAAEELALSGREQAALWDEARRIFEATRAELDGRIFHYPSAGTYHSFFAWDSGTNVIAGKRLFPEDAYSELAAIYSFQEPSGRIAHEVRFAGEEKDPMRKLTLYLVRKQFDRNGMSALIDPPNFIYALWDYYSFTRDERVWPLVAKAEKLAQYLLSERDLFGDGLVSIIHPWESGTDAAAVFDEPMGVNFKHGSAAVQYLSRYIKLLNELAEINFEPQTAAAQNIFAFEDVGFNSWLALGLTGLAKLFTEKGELAKAEKYQARARDMVAAMERIFWDDERGFFYPRFERRNPRLSKRKCATGLLPLMTGLVSEPKAGRLIEHLQNPQEFWTPYPVGFNAEDELAKDHLAFESMLLWRGHCVWANINWGLALALEQYGERKASRELARRFARLVLREGFREFYDSRTGRGMGAKNFTWPALVLDLCEALKL